MNLAGNISEIDLNLEKLSERLSEYFVTNNPEEVPGLDTFITSISLEHNCKALFPTIEEVRGHIKELRYFVHKTKRLEHKVLVASFHETDYYFIQKDDGSVSVCTAPYLYEETAVQLRIYEFGYYSTD